MTHHTVTFHGAALQARASGALFWAAHRTLIVADLHLGKAQRMAARGGALVPPWGDEATLELLQAEIEATGAERVISLGDGFDDDATDRLDAQTAEVLYALGSRADWLWITGNHDARLTPPMGEARAEIALDGLTLRHIARPGAGPDLSGHYHPKARLAGRRRPAFLVGATHLILPAFGTYTGGLDASDPVLADLVGPGLAVLTGPRALVIPYLR